ncbi:MAG: hypothetical protein K0R73_172 [Candidatus Midichloriaceae bacterium]|jgi:hypothetical protein|nr:hypothetical protein [Candidatus Midichloriaceae bacterium]
MPKPRDYFPDNVKKVKEQKAGLQSENEALKVEILNLNEKLAGSGKQLFEGTITNKMMLMDFLDKLSHSQFNEVLPNTYRQEVLPKVSSASLSTFGKFEEFFKVLKHFHDDVNAEFFMTLSHKKDAALIKVDFTDVPLEIVCAVNLNDFETWCEQSLVPQSYHNSSEI